MKSSEHKKNFAILSGILFVAIIALILFSYFITDENIKSSFSDLALIFIGVLVFQVILFLIRPQLFRNKSEY